ncbi:Carboxylesterase 5A, partial [Halocaridina rubra]
IVIFCLIVLASSFSVEAIKYGAPIDPSFLLPALESQDNIEEDVGDPVYVDVAQGRLMGQVRTYNNFSFNSFEGIPFAKPPVDELRFKDPVPADPWVGVLNATNAPSSCLQVVVLGHEDCLYLSVFTPLDSVNQSEPLPVMYFIYGGAFVTGGSRGYRGAQPLVSKNVILVTVNYRIGVLGFLSTEDAAAPGNQGLKDQTLGLQWVQDNIAAFGGDPQRVTIFGESAGAASVHYQMLTPY